MGHQYERLSVVPPGGTPLVSFVIPAYNHENYVRRAIGSIWRIQYPNIELIAIDDGSADGTPRVLRELEAKSPLPMRVVSKANEGLCRTLNLGIDMAKGKYIALLASDDEVLPNRLAQHVQFLEASPDGRLAGCYGDHEIIDTDGNVLNVTHHSKHPENPMLPLLGCSTPFSLQDVTFRAKVLQALRFDESLYFEDWDFFIRLCSQFRLHYISDVVSRYRAHSGGMNKNVAAMAVARLAIFNKHSDTAYVREYGRSRFKSNVELSNARASVLMEQFEDGRKWLQQSWRTWPAQALYSFPLALKLGAGVHAVRRARLLKHRINSFLKQLGV